MLLNLQDIAQLIGETHLYFKQQAQKQVNTALTLRNCLFGYYIVEYELKGEDRAVYGSKLFKELDKKLKELGFQQIRERHLYLC